MGNGWLRRQAIPQSGSLKGIAPSAFGKSAAANFT